MIQSFSTVLVCRRLTITSNIGSKRRRLVSLPTRDIVHITRLSLYALDLKILEDHGSLIRAKYKKTLIDIEISQHSESSLMEVHTYPIDTSQSSQKQSICDKLLKSFFMAFQKIIEPHVRITDPDVVRPSKHDVRVEKVIEVREIVKERVLVVCPHCNHKNEVGTRFCEKCGASI